MRHAVLLRHGVGWTRYLLKGRGRGHADISCMGLQTITDVDRNRCGYEGLVNSPCWNYLVGEVLMDPLQLSGEAPHTTLGQARVRTSDPVRQDGIQDVCRPLTERDCSGQRSTRNLTHCQLLLDLIRVSTCARLAGTACSHAPCHGRADLVHPRLHVHMSETVNPDENGCIFQAER